MVIEEGGDGRTINLCKVCYNAKLVQQGKQTLKLCEWKEVVEKKAHRGRLWKLFGCEQFLRGMWEYFTLKKGRCKEDSSGRCSRKTRRRARSVATRVSLPRGFGTRKKVRIQTVVPNRCAVPTSQWNWECFKEECRKEGKLCEGPLKGFGKLVRRWQWRTSAA